MKIFADSRTRLNFPFWLLSLSIVFGLTLPWLIQEGMFQDAMLYSCVSHNLGQGIGTFWFPQYSLLNIDGIPSFHEQLPLVIGIQGLLFKLLGDSIYIERLYTFLMIVLNIWLIQKIWKKVFQENKDYAAMGWLPVFFWMIIPLSFWSYRYNMMENSVSVFALAAILIGYKALESNKYTLLWELLAGLFVFMASFSKGIPGLFPLAFPALYWLTTQKISFSRTVRFTAVMLLAPTIIYGIFLILPNSRESLSIYFFERLLGRTHHMHTVSNRFAIMIRLFYELLPLIGIVLIVFVMNLFKSIKPVIKENGRSILLFLGIGLSGTFPLMLTMVQKGFYMVPAFPYFAIAFALLILPIIHLGLSRLNSQSSDYKIFISLAALIFLTVGIITFTKRNEVEREKDIITDVYEIGKIVPKYAAVTVPETMYDEYNFILQGYLVRYFNISISPYDNFDYYLKEKKMPDPVPDIYKKLDLNLSKYELYKRITP